MKKIYINLGLKFLKLGGYKRIDAAYDCITHKMSGMILSNSDSFPPEYFAKIAYYDFHPSHCKGELPI